MSMKETFNVNFTITFWKKNFLIRNMYDQAFMVYLSVRLADFSTYEATIILHDLNSLDELWNSHS